MRNDWGKNTMKITILYDNTSNYPDLIPDWGFSCLVEAYGKKSLFDTGAKGEILLNNMKTLKVNPLEIDEIFISHLHWDHTGGLSSVLAINPISVYIPWSCPEPSNAREIIKIRDKTELHKNIFSTGELLGIEQSLVVKTEKGLVIIVGCSHPGVGKILSSVADMGEVYAIIGGLHGFREFHILEPIPLVCPTHCTMNISRIKTLFPEKYVEGGVGTIIEI